MGKKKHRSRRAKKAPDDDCETSEEENQLEIIGTSCPHASKAVNLSNVKKSLKDVTFSRCQQCVSSTVNLDGECENVIWMCLYCGNQGCSRNSVEKHALLHFQTPHSDTHSLAISTVDLTNLWCYECDSNVAVNGNKKVSECIEYIKKSIALTNTLPSPQPDNHSAKGTGVLLENKIVKEDVSQVRTEPIKNNIKSEVLPKSSCKTQANKLEIKETIKSDNIPKIKGLINLGNTCFFNSVLQSLIQTNILYEILSSREMNGISTTIGNSNCDEKTCTDSADAKLPVLEITLPETGALSHAFCSFFKDYTGNKNKTVSPSQLLGQICKRAPQFRGALQQDSHELLRHLLDGLKSEEIKRYQAGILRAFGLGEKINPKSVDEKTKTAVKAYGRCIPNTLIDHIFSGQLISTVLCEECGMSSQVFEPFLDLSLPVTEEKVTRPTLVKKSVNESESRTLSDKVPDRPSKHQEKKSKKQAKRNAKIQRNRIKQDKKCITNKTEEKTTGSGEEDIDSDQLNIREESLDSVTKEESETSDADVEDNAESGSTCSFSNVSEPAPTIVAGKELPNDDDTWNSPTPKSNVCKTVSSVNEDVCERMVDLMLNNDDSVLRINGLQGDDNENSDEMDDNLDKRHDKTESVQKLGTVGKTGWMSRSLTTLAPRYQAASQECSIYSCLNQFTAPELLTGPNKFGCENCTRNKKERDSISRDSDDKSGKKSSIVYTNASKQLLIFSPPAILTLHLKRFQQVGYSLRKVNRHVEFPLTLNLAPFCSSICLGLPTLKENQHHVLYYLYAVVEHSGRLTGGHYTAYVRANPNDEKLHTFLNLKPVVQEDLKKLINEMQTKLCNCEEITKCSNYVNDGVVARETNASRWYHISDSCISEVSESSVLRCQAYLLFYRRIL